MQQEATLRNNLDLKQLSNQGSRSHLDQENIDGSNKQLYVTQRDDLAIKDETVAAGAPVSLEHKYHLMKKKLKKQKEISDAYQ